MNLIYEVETALVDDEFLSSEDEFCSTNDDNPSFENVDMMDHHNEGEFTFPKNIYETIQLPDVTDIESCKERKCDCIDQQLPIIDHKYPSDDSIEDMYRKYACAIGFDVRKSKNKKKCGIVYMKIFYVTWKVSQIHPLVDTTLDQKISKIKRKTYTSSTGCNARIRFKVIPGTTKWWLYEFEEKHNHPLISRDNMLFLLHDWQLDDTKKSFILTMSNQNIGATIAHRLYTSIHGGYNFVGGLIDDFKNYMRDLNCVIGGSDAQMLVDKLNNRKENYRVENKQLNVLFWADETSKINYKEFVDVVSFDATFRTNKLEMTIGTIWFLFLLLELIMTIPPVMMFLGRRRVYGKVCHPRLA
uniref:FAR1 domain-containing protein n=1 Tax=Lactuca sativa TaxID=4236 RepID=A0A9R1WUV1_LACSA|nr:hypothetical protein LSAT_V11C900490370 [Lactuca sativa]